MNTPALPIVDFGSETAREQEADDFGQFDGCFLDGGVIDDDPLFVDADGSDDVVGTEDDDVHLLGDSPCINSGSNGAPELPETDLDGHARILCAVVDMGAYESGIADYDCDGDVDLSDFAWLAACMTGADMGPYLDDCEAFDFEHDDDVDLADFVLFRAALKGPQ